MNKNTEKKELLTCPECNNTFQHYAPFSYSPCPSCNTVFNKDGKDRRSNLRIAKVVPCIFYIEGAYDRISFSAKTVDISESGVGIRYAIFPLPQNSIVEIEMMNLATNTLAVVMWSNEISKIESASGLKFIQPIQLITPVIA
ncbi:MAG: PilZ domain-containing protein [Deltaproteobacteria bacterium]|nr:PilZ domain-containing protein [Deltaproteobacteria bacterium]